MILSTGEHVTIYYVDNVRDGYILQFTDLEVARREAREIVETFDALAVFYKRVYDEFGNYLSQEFLDY